MRDGDSEEEITRESGGAKEKKEDEERGCGEGREREEEREVGRRWRERGGPVPSYHAASMDPLIFAALRFCLALSTLHTSTADRRHKTLYWSSAERERKGGRERVARETERERESPRPRRCLRSIVSNAYGGAHITALLQRLAVQRVLFSTFLRRSTEVR